MAYLERRGGKRDFSEVDANFFPYDVDVVCAEGWATRDRQPVVRDGYRTTVEIITITEAGRAALARSKVAKR